jgi:hypothetical protein
MLCWLFGDTIKERLIADAHEFMATRGTGASIEERTRREAELRAKYQELQRLEVALCDAFGEEHGRVHPEAWLGIRRIANAERPVRQTSYEMPPGTPPTLGVPHNMSPKSGMNPGGFVPE